MGKGYKRRNFFIKKDFQGKMILGCFLFVTGGCLLFIVLLGFFSANSMTILYSNHDLQLGQTPVMLIKQVLEANWVLIVVGGIFLVVASMLLTHRIAGPLFRFEQALDRMADGRLDETIHLRKKDEGKELAEKFNTFNGRLSKSLRMLTNHSVALQSLIEQAATMEELSAEQKERLASLCWSMQEHNRKILATCNSFRLKDD